MNYPGRGLSARFSRLNQSSIFSCLSWTLLPLSSLSLAISPLFNLSLTLSPLFSLSLTLSPLFSLSLTLSPLFSLSLTLSPLLRFSFNLRSFSGLFLAFNAFKAAEYSFSLKNKKNFKCFF